MCKEIKINYLLEIVLYTDVLEVEIFIDLNLTVNNFNPIVEPIETMIVNCYLVIVIENFDNLKIKGLKDLLIIEIHFVLIN